MATTWVPSGRRVTADIARRSSISTSDPAGRFLMRSAPESRTSVPAEGGTGVVTRELSAAATGGAGGGLGLRNESPCRLRFESAARALARAVESAVPGATLLV